MDLSNNTIKKIFEKKILELTKKTVPQEELFDFQLSGGWLR